MLSLSRRTFLRQAVFGAGALTLVPHLHAAGDTGLPRSTPEAMGIDSGAILAFLDGIAAKGIELHSLMLLRHGQVVAEGWWAPYAAERRHWLYSLSKSFTSTAIGLAVSEGLLTVEDKVVKFFPDDLPATVSENLAALRVKDLLTMAAGQASEPMAQMVKQESWAKAFLAWPVPQAPGSGFLYNSAATYMCSAIVQKLTGQKIVDYLQPRLFAPLGIEGATWETCPLGINTGGWGLALKTEDLAKFGQLLLQKGAWKGRQVVPAVWVEEATTFKIQQPAKAHPKETDDWQQGYGYQFWRCTHGAFRGDGAFGQFCVVMPEQDAVFIMTGETNSLQGELDLLWADVLPAMKGAALPENRPAEQQLRQRLASLQLPAPAGDHSVPAMSSVGNHRFTLEPNDRGLSDVQFEFAQGGCTVTFRAGETKYPIACKWGGWAMNETALPGVPPRLAAGGRPPQGTSFPLAASVTWKDAALVLTLRFIETPHHDTVTCTFTETGVKIAFLNSMSQLGGKTSDGRPVLSGTLVAG